jgi:hypothetical protein
MRIVVAVIISNPPVRAMMPFCGVLPYKAVRSSVVSSTVSVRCAATVARSFFGISVAGAVPHTTTVTVVV